MGMPRDAESLPTQYTDADMDDDNDADMSAHKDVDIHTN